MQLQICDIVGRRRAQGVDLRFALLWLGKAVKNYNALYRQFNLALIPLIYACMQALTQKMLCNAVFTE